MNRHGLVIAAALAVTLAAGCASTNTNQNRASEDEKTYVTGSRIPVKDKATGSVSATTDRRAIEDMIRRPGTAGTSSN